jgi:NDP-sugar pyrophosphorylase family protein
MEGMILAAGAGTRLGNLTHTRPKALVEVAGRPLLEWVLQRYEQAGVTRVIVNTHHHDDQIRAFLDTSTPEGMDVEVSFEPDGPYETGGGLFHAKDRFLSNSPFLLHNADVLSTIDLTRLVDEHHVVRTAEGDGVVASLAVQERDSRRVLLFDELGLLGWENRGSDRGPDGRVQVRDPVGLVSRLSFTGIHVVDPKIFQLSERTGAFSIISLYLDLAAEGWIIRPTDVSRDEWFDIGTPARLEEARTRFSY